MTIIAAAFLLFTLADESKDTTALVAAAKDAKAKRKTSTTKVITNADVKKAKGKLTVLPGKPEEPRPLDTSSPLAQFEAEKRAKADLAARVVVAEKKVADLEQELAVIEQAYYNEGDPDVRDRMIRPKFQATKALLEVAKTELHSLLPGGEGTLKTP
ncbi:MAG TPA: hypothetical protein VN181_07455 [Thermoanaerobaculia bacterium]|nr:hypothetical protein [Thermoanaerobaculia bacterium]